MSMISFKFAMVMAYLFIGWCVAEQVHRGKLGFSLIIVLLWPIVVVVCIVLYVIIGLFYLCGKIGEKTTNKMWGGDEE